jgi:hypothetical protein
MNRTQQSVTGQARWESDALDSRAFGLLLSVVFVSLVALAGMIAWESHGNDAPEQIALAASTPVR